MPSIGSYCNGDEYVLSPVGVTGITPTETVGDATPVGEATQTGIVKHGAMLNPGIGGHSSQGFTNINGTGLEVGYSAAKKITLPLEFSAGEEGSIVKSIFKEAPNKECFPAIKALAVLTVVKAAPPAGAFRPAVASTDKTSYWTEPDDLIDLTTLPNRALIAGGPALSSVLGALRNWQPSSWSEGDPSRYLAATYNNPFGDYPVRSIGPYVSMAVMMLTMNHSLGEKRDLAVALGHIGIDAQAFLAGRTSGFDYGGYNGWGGEGGVAQRGYKLAIGVTGALLNENLFKDWANSALHPAFPEDAQINYLSAGKSTAVQSSLGGRPGRTDYVSGDVGMPEWTETSLYRDPLMGDRKEGATYRSITVRNYVLHAMACHMYPGLSAILNQPAMLDFADRMMQRSFLDGSGTVGYARSVPTGSDVMTTWEKAVWDAYRTESGMPAIWNW